jgi:hypothetical protein
MDNGALDAHWGEQKTYDFGRRTLVEIVMTIMARELLVTHYDDNPEMLVVMTMHSGMDVQW